MGKIKTPFSHASWTTGTAVGVVVLLVALALVAFLATLAVGVFMVFVIVWNVQDIGAVGANFWNVAWIILAAIVLLSIIGNALRGK